jgi:S1-C subfamily serine protease/predicted esterase
LGDLQQTAMKAAVARVAPSVVQIETSGGADVIGSGPGSIRRGTGPTTGLVVAADGYIISSAFNFANKPSAIFVTIPGHGERYVAKEIAHDHTRMLTLLKIDVKGLPVPTAAPKKDMQVGEWALALGRTWTSLNTPPSVSVGIISAVGRIWGKAIQTDAKVSPVNYGGPLVDVQGRVLGVLVPASPRGQDETAGVEWYDSGIGFAIPLEDINSVLPRLKQGQELRKGLLGITLQSADIYGATPVIGSVAPDSAAQRAGIKPGDTVLEINGHPIVRQAQILHLLGEKYEGDTVSVKVRRGKKELAFANLKLAGSVTAFEHAFFGILPMRDDPELGEEIRFVFPKSPAEDAGLKPGDRIQKWSIRDMPPRPFSGRDELTALLNQLSAGTEIQLEVSRKESKKTETVKVTLGLFSEAVPDRLPEPATLKKALAPRKTALPPGLRPGASETKKDDAKEEKKKPDTGLVKRTTTARDHEYRVYVPPDYDPNISYALVVWLHPSGKTKDRDTEDVLAAWEDYCSDNHVIILCPKTDNATWLGSDTDFILEEIREVMAAYTIDHERIVAHGMGNGGEMAYYLGFNARDLIRGVAVSGAAFTQPKDNVANQRLAFFLVAGSRDAAAPAMAETKTKLRERKFPVVYREVADMGRQYLDADILHDLVNWIDSLDRQ